MLVSRLGHTQYHSQAVPARAYFRQAGRSIFLILPAHSLQVYPQVSQAGTGPAGPSARRPCLIGEIEYRQSPMKTPSFNQIKEQEARNRMAALRRARRSPKAAAAEQRRASLVGNSAKWKITNLNQVARAIARWT